MVSKIGFGGSCHWCTEAIFLSLKGVVAVQQGWIASDGQNSTFSEAVIVEFDERAIAIQTLIAVHLYTHSCTINHSMRDKYRSAVYTFNERQAMAAQNVIDALQPEFKSAIITKVIPYKRFRLNSDSYLNYYYSNPDKPFCQNVVNPKLRVLLARFANVADAGKLSHL
ncbi:peptide-methionine (S)-S-oxide reductase [Mucilaginibacter ginsenosidivorax]|uniref:peptide-methionine (S)-S-oxide reductase n=1 Tax=Mucilaginibacter ginsenosidivorax TaxID=862126 RepID=A0A5B8W405_9SPHI|nr:peptide-methionine (S)-S-oxide reductase [Mucilaginibacter ginsenosidivorax]QEC78800.1 peptide methionine sulfoxide reductase [Mucilaginibacter ginsenosidivorax]